MINHGLKIVNAWFIETGTAPDMVSRNLITHIDPSTMQQFASQTRDGELLTADNLAGIAGRIIQPDANHERQVHIANGWAARRYRFVLRVANPSQPNGAVYYYTGYTDTNEFSIATNNFDQHMRLYFNNVIQVNQVMKPSPTGYTPFINVVECNHMIHPATLGATQMDFATSFNPQGGFGVQNQPTSLRPLDLMYNLSSQHKANMSGQHMGTTFVDTRPGVDLCKSKRRNTVPSHYLSKAAEAMIYGYSEAAQQAQSGPHTAFDIATAHSEENTVYADRFFSILANEYGYHQNGFITWGDFNRSNPELQQAGVTFVMTHGEAKKKDIYVSERGNFDTMVNDRRPQTMLITQVMQSIPSVLLESLITFARINVTNMTLDGSVVVTVTDPISFVELPKGYLIPFIPTLERRLRHIIFSDIAQNQYVPFDLTLTIDIFGETFAMLGYNGEFPTPYSIPTYCDSMLSPIVTTNGNVLGQMSNDVNYLISQVCGI